MSHRAQQIVDSIVANLKANTAPGWSVYRHRAASLNAAELELPAASVVMGADPPIQATGASNLAFLDGLLEVVIVLIAQKSFEDDLVDALVEMRRQAHISVMADRTQGLAFVIDTRYAGADAPNVSPTESKFNGVLHTRWAVHYRMNIADPS
jgi:hypothetical protein